MFAIITSDLIQHSEEHKYFQTCFIVCENGAKQFNCNTWREKLVILFHKNDDFQTAFYKWLDRKAFLLVICMYEINKKKVYII